MASDDSDELSGLRVLLTLQERSNGVLLWDVAQEICTISDCIALAIHLLDKGSDEVANLQDSGVRKPRDVAHCILEKWLRRYPTTCFGETLCKTLGKIGREDLVLPLQSKLSSLAAERMCGQLHAKATNTLDQSRHLSFHSQQSILQSFSPSSQTQQGVALLPVSSSLAGFLQRIQQQQLRVASAVSEEHAPPCSPHLPLQSPASGYQPPDLDSPLSHVPPEGLLEHHSGNGCHDDEKPEVPLAWVEGPGRNAKQESAAEGEKECSPSLEKTAIIFVSKLYIDEFKREAQSDVEEVLAGECHIQEKAVKILNLRQSSTESAQVSDHLRKLPGPALNEAPTVVKIRLAIEMSEFAEVKNDLKTVIASSLVVKQSQIDVRGTESGSVWTTVAFPLIGLPRLLQLVLTLDGRKQLSKAHITKIVPVGQLFAINITTEPLFEMLSLKEALSKKMHQRVSMLSQAMQQSGFIRPSEILCAKEGLCDAMLHLTLTWSGSQKAPYRAPVALVTTRDGRQESCKEIEGVHSEAAVDLSSTGPQKRSAAPDDQGAHLGPKMSPVAAHQNFIISELQALANKFDDLHSKTVGDDHLAEVCGLLEAYSANCEESERLLLKVVSSFVHSQATQLWQAVCGVALIRAVLIRSSGFRDEQRQELARSGATMSCALVKHLARQDRPPEHLVYDFERTLSELSEDEQKGIKCVLKERDSQGVPVWQRFSEFPFEEDSLPCTSMDQLWSTMLDRQFTVGKLYRYFLIAGQLTAARCLEVC